jgi:hypothetical protein
MDFFMKKIFDGKADEFVHAQFQKFSKGEFEERAMIRVKKSGSRFSVSTSSEYARELVCNLGAKLGEDRTRVTGALISALDLSGFDYKEKKSAIGIRKYIIDSEMTGSQLVELCNKVPKAFFGLSFKAGDDELKIQDKSPKSAKGIGSAKKEGEKLKIDFCKLKTSDENLIKGLVFDDEAKNFKSVEIKHTFVIDEIIIPSEKESGDKEDFAKIRELAKRKGKIIRELDIDGKKIRKEKEFIA